MAVAKPTTLNDIFEKANAPKMLRDFILTDLQLQSRRDSKRCEGGWFSWESQ